MATGDLEPGPPFDRSTVDGRRAEVAYLDALSDIERDQYDRGHRYVTVNPEITPEREAHLARQLADLNVNATDS